MYVENPCTCGHARTMHYWDKDKNKYTSCDEPLGYNGDEVDMCGEYKPRPPRPAKFDLNGLVLEGIRRRF